MKANEKESAFMVINMPIVSIITVAISAIKKLEFRRGKVQNEILAVVSIGKNQRGIA